MPVENEFKYVLKDNGYSLLDFMCREYPEYLRISQAYIGDVRIREELTKYANVGKCTFTYKKKVRNELIEIECEISEEDYKKLKSVSDTELGKLRFTIPDGPDANWFVDFFADEEGDVYFIMAEYETTTDIKEPPPIIDCLKSYLVHVDNGTFRLTSHALCNVEYAKNLMWKFSQKPA